MNASVIAALIAGAHFLLALSSIYHTLLYKRDPRSAIGWIMVILFAPFIGAISYYLFGINRLRSRARGMKHQLFDVDYELAQKPLSPQRIEGNAMREAGRRISGCAASQGNLILPLFNGDQAYPAMLQAIEDAQQQIFLASYILKTDTIGHRFIEALSKAKERGVGVRVLIDGIGQLHSRPRASKVLKRKGLDTATFLPPTLWPPSVYVNLRNHRKLLVVDDNVAFAGGMNISDDHVLAHEKPSQVSDVHFKILGPAVVELAGLFRQDWHYSTGQEIAATTPVQMTRPSTVECRVIADGPDEQLDSLALVIKAAISCAKHHVDIMSPYFLPNRELIATLQSAAHRGVRVRIILPERNNLFYMNWANQNMLAELLRWDIEVIYQPPPFCHSKLITIDSNYALIGSANIDPRSLRLNFELGIEVFCHKFVSELDAYIAKTLEHGTPLTFQQLANRPVGIRLRDSAAALLSPYL